MTENNEVVFILQRTLWWGAKKLNEPKKANMTAQCQ